MSVILASQHDLTSISLFGHIGLILLFSFHFLFNFFSVHSRSKGPGLAVFLACLAIDVTISLQVIRWMEVGASRC